MRIIIPAYILQSVLNIEIVLQQFVHIPCIFAAEIPFPLCFVPNSADAVLYHGFIELFVVRTSYSHGAIW